MMPLDLPSDVTGPYAYTPPPAIVRQSSASTGDQTDVEVSGLEAMFKPSAPSEPREDDTAAFAARRYIVLLDPREELEREISKKAEETKKAEAAYRERIHELAIEGEFEDIALNNGSEKDFWTFLKSQDFFWRGHLVLLENGNLRAVWKNKEREQIGLQFLGNGIIQYVIFKLRPREKSMSRVAGRDNIDGILRQIEAFELSDLIKV